MSDHFQLAGLEFEVRRSERRKTVGLTIDRGGELIVHAPRDAAQNDLEHWARANSSGSIESLRLRRQ
jgi:hypothetical protein